MNRQNIRTLALAAASTLLLGGHAMASPIVVLNDGADQDTIISHGNYYIQCLQPELSLVPYSDSVVTSYGIYISFSYFSDILFGGISGNSLPQFPGIPLQTPSIFVPGGLRLEGMTLGPSSSDFLPPGYDPVLGDASPAFITHGTYSGADFDITSFVNGEMAYIGYASSDSALFGYMQIQRVNETDWKLIGFAYDVGSISVVPLPTPPAGALIGMGLAVAGARSRRN
ncbi:MAG: hypothetical protein KIT19_11225 [Phycisphaeraceae bacterium]|nr:hypothetical protein [Phycisphaeraceae bacterium]